MISLNLKYTLGLFFILFAIHNATCLKCFKCSSKYDPKCADPFDNSTIPITDCTLEKGLLSMCRKIKQKVITVNGEWEYIRDCASLEEVGTERELFCVTKTGADNITAEYCTCDVKDGCNSSSLFSPMPMLVLFTLLILMYKWC